MNKMQKTAKALDTFCKVLFWLAIAGSVIVAAATVILAFAGDKAMSETSSLTLGSVTFNLAEGFGPDATYASGLIFSMIPVVALGVATVIIGLNIIRSILAPMKEGVPFDGTMSKNIRKLGWFSLISGGVWSIITIIFESLMLVVYDFEKIFIGDAITDIVIESDISLDFIIVAAVIFLLSYVFRYGEALQQQADETL